MPDCASPLVDAPAARTGAAGAVVSTRAAVDGRAARGPFRPDVWLSARQRSGVRLAAHYFRATDVLALTGLGVAALGVSAPDGLLSLSLAEAAPTAAGAAAVLGLLRGLGLYRFGRERSAAGHMSAALGVTLAGATLAIGLGLLLDRQAPERSSLDAAAAFAVGAVGVIAGLHALWLSLVARWRRQGALAPNIVIVGATKHAEAVIRRALERRDLNVLGVFDDRLARSPDSVAGVPVLGDAEALLNHRMTPYVDRIVLAIDAQGGPRVRELTRRLETLPNPLTVLVDSETGKAALDRLASAPLAPLQGPVDPDRRAFNKRLQDLLVGLMALIVAAPVMALTALAIRLDSPGPIFFRQRRHGFNQEEIVVWKFRSMRHAAADATASRQVTVGDDRVTRVGRFIRATSLDELPQIFNVLSGEMSLVGPRPHAIGMKTGETESARLVAEYAHRHRIKPGMTGWAAVQGSRGPLHSAAEVRRRVQLDIDYVERQSFWLDLRILLVTLPVLLGDRAAVR
ncbi:exopolysaccharide biosynthesis polyprenyl glycosylphosphotransferase [Brevundimonas sp.]|uniref:exopolysaccharide biosynthesis polyprenyl glycosylphosphotransferase n=1 Tax=Brevundimonas sp. TaxID=1871086 RepID=UPI0019AFBD3C|nr:exopolysaccharide biosynthesis polyprenyl glycosylphosphotransferase [Brevundimonas sp.]MBD3835566.1 exopolysaccharide biosynthesis polyprenyl glycosylphosphotransferase [Brevundimonas sp.]